MAMDESRVTVEKELALEERMLTAVADLLNRKVELARWPEDVRNVFLLALWKKKCRKGDREAWKAFRTARHLYVDRKRLPPEPADPTPLQRRLAERVRADLPRLVKLRAGGYLTPSEKTPDFTV
jgi:hypothetical protein